MINVITLFSGYDSQCLALNRLGVEYDLVAWCEIDKNAIKAHNILFPQYADRNLGDVSNVDWSAIEKPIDLLTYSSPCQDFSNAGLQRGGEEGSGTRSGLLWEVEKAITALRPKYLVFENVAALVSDKFLPTFNKWQVRLNNYGYTNFSQLMNAKDYGVPQNRLRIFMVSILDCHRAYYFPQPFKLERRLKDVLEHNVEERNYLSDERVKGLLLSTEKEKDAGRGFEFAPLTGEEECGRSVTTNAGCRKTDNFIAEPQVEIIGDLEPDNRRKISGSIRQQNMVVGCNGISPCIPASNFKHEFKVAEPQVQVVGNLQADNKWQDSVVRQQNVVIGGEGISPCITALHSNHAFKYAEPQVIGELLRYEGTEPRCHQVAQLYDQDQNQQAGRVYDPDGLCPSIMANKQGGQREPKIMTGIRIRRLTERELYRLMDVEEKDIDTLLSAPIPRTQHAKLAGNSIVVACLYYIFRNLFVDTEPEAGTQTKLF